MPDGVVKIVVANTFEIVRDGIALVIEKDKKFEVIGQAADGYTTLKLCRLNEPDILLMDFEIVNPSGKDVFEKLRASQPELKIIITSSNIPETEAYNLLSKGAMGFVPKQAPGNDFVNVIRSVSNGYVSLPSDFLQGFVSLRKNISKTGNVYGLSPRELEVFEYSTRGENTRDIADKLNISVRTVETHRNSIYRKTSTNSIAELTEVGRNL